MHHSRGESAPHFRKNKHRRIDYRGLNSTRGITAWPSGIDRDAIAYIHLSNIGAGCDDLTRHLMARIMGSRTIKAPTPPAS